MKRKSKLTCPAHPRFLRTPRGAIEFWVNDSDGGAYSENLSKLNHTQREEAACIAECWFRRRAEKSVFVNTVDYRASMAWRDWLNERGGMCT